MKEKLHAFIDETLKRHKELEEDINTVIFTVNDPLNLIGKKTEEIKNKIKEKTDFLAKLNDQLKNVKKEIDENIKNTSAESNQLGPKLNKFSDLSKEIKKANNENDKYELQLSELNSKSELLINFKDNAKNAYGETHSFVRKLTDAQTKGEELQKSLKENRSDIQNILDKIRMLKEYDDSSFDDNIAELKKQMEEASLNDKKINDELYQNSLLIKNLRSELTEKTDALDKNLKDLHSLIEQVTDQYSSENKILFAPKDISSEHSEKSFSETEQPHKHTNGPSVLNDEHIAAIY